MYPHGVIKELYHGTIKKLVTIDICIETLRGSNNVKIENRSENPFNKVNNNKQTCKKRSRKIGNK